MKERIVGTIAAGGAALFGLILILGAQGLREPAAQEPSPREDADFVRARELEDDLNWGVRQIAETARDPEQRRAMLQEYFQLNREVVEEREERFRDAAERLTRDRPPHREVLDLKDASAERVAAMRVRDEKAAMVEAQIAEAKGDMELRRELLAKLADSRAHREMAVEEAAHLEADFAARERAGLPVWGVSEPEARELGTPEEAQLAAVRATLASAFDTSLASARDPESRRAALARYAEENVAAVAQEAQLMRQVAEQAAERQRVLELQETLPGAESPRVNR